MAVTIAARVAFLLMCCLLSVPDDTGEMKEDAGIAVPAV